MESITPVTNMTLFVGFFFTVLENYFGYSDDRYKTSSTNVLLKDFTAKRDTRFNHSVQVRMSKNAKVAVETTLIFRFKNMKYRQLVNKISILRVLRKYNDHNTILFPKLYSSCIRKHSIGMRIEYINGKELKSSPNENIITMMSEILSMYELLTKKLPLRVVNAFPKRTLFDLSITFPLYVLLACIKDKKNIHTYISLCSTYYLHVLEHFLTKQKTSYTLAHRDLHSGNIILKKKKVYIIDNEITCLAETSTDLAIITRYYFRKLKDSGTNKLLVSQLNNETEVKRFIRLSIFYAIQAVVFESKTNAYYKDALKYIKYLSAVAHKEKYKSNAISILLTELSNSVKFNF